MSSRIQHILLQHEEIPPPGNWEKICRELDDAGAGFRFPETLSGLSITPPRRNWEMIRQTLEEEAFNGTVAEKLYQVELPAPVTAWGGIAAALDLKPAARRTAPVLKYAVAAILVGVLSFSAFKIFQRPAQSLPVLAGAPDPVHPESISHEPVPITPAPASVNRLDDHLSVEQEAREDAALEASKHTYARLDLSPVQKAEIAAAFRFDENSNSGSENTDSPPGQENRYVLLMNPDGHFIRMSRKLSNLLCCVSGEEQDKECKSMVDNWRKQLACTDAAHPGNFMDILNLISSLQEK